METNKEFVVKFEKLLQENKENLDNYDYYLMTQWLKKAERSVNARDTKEVIENLEQLIRDIQTPELFSDQQYLAPRYVEVLSVVLKELERRKRQETIVDDKFFTAFDDYRPTTFKRFLESLAEPDTTIETREDGSIVFKPRDPDLLHRELTVCEEDGMGYCPDGPHKVFDTYQNRDTEEIQFWI